MLTLWIRSTRLAQDDAVWNWLSQSPNRRTTHWVFLHSTRGSLGLWVSAWDVHPKDWQHAIDYNKQVSDFYFRKSMDKHDRLVYSDPGDSLLKGGGFVIYHRPVGVFKGWGIDIPYWFLSLLFFAIAVRQGAKYFRNHTKPGHCAKCGYDLRATPDRCPECGTIPAQVV